MTTTANHRPRALRLALVAAAALVAALGLGSGTSHAAVQPASPGTSLGPVSVAGSAPSALAPGWRADMLRRVNDLRAQAGVAALVPCASLRRAAQGYALLMASTGTLGHVGPDGTAPWDRMRAQGFRWQAAAENTGKGQSSVAEVMRTWAASPEHLANLLDPRMRQVGFGLAVGDGAEAYWVQDFGSGSGC